MKKIILLLPLIALVVFCCTLSVSGDKNKKDKKEPLGQSVVVLELFTSQGCSSCPPADRLLGSYTNKKNIFPLSFHVDYWNQLGWKDPFSDHAFSVRQEMYASLFGLDGVYTPQLVVNGQKEMVGSEEAKIADAVNKISSETPSSNITIDSIRPDGKKVYINYSANGALNNSVVNAALVQNRAVTPVKAGENSGVVLTNYNVVRSFNTIKAPGTSGKIILDLPSNDKKEFSVILFLQDKTTFIIYSAARSDL